MIGHETNAEVHSVCAIFDTLRKLADEQDKVSIGDVLDAIGGRS